MGYGNDDTTPEEAEEIRSRTKLKGVKGHRKGGPGSGESSQTVHERALWNDTKREIRAEAHEASRPKAEIREKSALAADEKALEAARRLKEQHAGQLYRCKDDFADYLERRGTELDADTVSAIEAWFDDADADELDGKWVAKWIKEFCG